MRYRWSKLVVASALAFAACSGKATQGGGLEVIIGTNVTTPADLDVVRVEVSQETAPGVWGSKLVANDFHLPDEATLPTTFSIEAGKSGDQSALIRVIGKKGDAPLVLREAQLQIPTSRVAELRMMLAVPCVGQVKVDGAGEVQATCPKGQSCQPDTGVCGDERIDAALLPDYVSGDEALDGGSDVSAPEAGKGDAGTDASADAGAPDTGPPPNPGDYLWARSLSAMQPLGVRVGLRRGVRRRGVARGPRRRRRRRGRRVEHRRRLPRRPRRVLRELRRRRAADPPLGPRPRRGERRSRVEHGDRRGRERLRLRLARRSVRRRRPDRRRAQPGRSVAQDGSLDGAREGPGAVGSGPRSSRSQIRAFCIDMTSVPLRALAGGPRPRASVRSYARGEVSRFGRTWPGRCVLKKIDRRIGQLSRNAQKSTRT